MTMLRHTDLATCKLLNEYSADGDAQKIAMGCIWLMVRLAVLARIVFESGETD